MVVQALYALGLHLRLGQGGQEHGSQYGYDGDYDEKFDQRKARVEAAGMFGVTGYVFHR